MYGNGVATAVPTYAPLILSCYPAPWTAVLPTHRHTETRLEKALFVCRCMKEGASDSADPDCDDFLHLFALKNRSSDD